MSSNPANLFVIAAPSGAGKTTLVKRLLERNPGLEFSVSYTTRKQRTTEIDGRDYFFVDEKRFLQLQEDGELLESALVFGNHYGTGRSQVEQRLAKGKHVILEIDWQGAQQVRESMPGCVSIFILPPSRPELERRLRDRGTDSDGVIERRLQEAHGDMTHWAEFDFVIINDDLDSAVGELEAILHGAGAANRSSDPDLQRTLRSIVGADLSANRD
jgi:guanylate kinase